MQSQLNVKTGEATFVYMVLVQNATLLPLAEKRAAEKKREDELFI